MPGYELIGAEEKAEVDEVFAKGAVLFRHGFDALRGDCFKVRDFERDFAVKLQVKHALAVTSGTAALRVALAALGVGPGDEVITQTFTFVATIEAIIEAGATPVCADVDETLNLDPIDLERKITERTKAIIAVHMLGTPARLREISAICRRHGVALVEDTAWGCGGNLGGKALGTWGDIATFSFDYAKTMTTGEGGMVVTDNTRLFEKAVAWHDHGHENNPTLPRWEDSRSGSGFNFRMMELQGAVGIAQLRKLDTVVEAQRANAARLWEAIRDLRGITPRAVPEGAYETCDALVFMVKDRQTALNCRAALLDHGVSTRILPEAYTWHFAGTWTHMPSLVAVHGDRLEGRFPQSRSYLDRAVSLPVGVRMAEGYTQKVRTALASVLEGGG